MATGVGRYSQWEDGNINKVVQIWPGKTVTCLHTSRPGHIWITLYIEKIAVNDQGVIGFCLNRRCKLSSLTFKMSLEPVLCKI
jgi:hypothetical protein